jgi:hypothetical protein
MHEYSKLSGNAQRVLTGAKGKMPVRTSVVTTHGLTGRSMRPVELTIWPINGRTIPNLVLCLN